jgi:hypothetical protein
MTGGPAIQPDGRLGDTVYGLREADAECHIARGGDRESDMAVGLTDQELTEIEARVEAAPGFAWHIGSGGRTVFDTYGAVVADCQDPAVATLLLHARGDLRRLTEEVLRLRAELQSGAAATSNPAPPTTTG